MFSKAKNDTSSEEILARVITLWLGENAIEMLTMRYIEKETYEIIGTRFSMSAQGAWDRIRCDSKKMKAAGIWPEDWK